MSEDAFERLLREIGPVVEENDGFRLYFECSFEATFSTAKGGGDGIGPTKAGKGIKSLILTDANGLPVAVNTGPRPRRSRNAFCSCSNSC